ncbi:uncharacterized protein LOC101847826 isoform X3 [Aplysia californica]|nr:uncharacterized protein LOC101847826 isoform X3 [Aplysia californica]XP_035826553.1 uncharacterized protein LOC101847826 isoform X3 [Aplysia californica]
MGNSHSKKSTPSVYYAPGYGVTLGSRPPSLDLDNDVDLREEGIRLRPHLARPRYKSPSPASDRDSAIGGVTGSEMSQSQYSEVSANRDSFYSSCTAESGFDDLMACFEDVRAQRKWSNSAKENFPPGSLRERNLNLLYRAHHGYDPGLNNLGRSVKPGLDTLSDVSSERSGIVSSRSQHSSCAGDSQRSGRVTRTNVDPLEDRFALQRHPSSDAGTTSGQSLSGRQDMGVCGGSAFTGDGVVGMSEPASTPHLLSAQSSPYGRRVHPCSRGRGHSPATGQQHFSPIRRPDGSCLDQQLDYDPSLDASESIRSFNSSGDGIDWDVELEDSGERMSTLPEFQQSLSDVQFQQSLMQRIHEWSTFAEEYNKSRSPTPHCSPIRFVRRSRSLDRHLGDSSAVLVSDHDIAGSKPTEMEPTTEKNLECLEYELQDIQGEFESITSKLHELIEQGNAKKASPKSSQAPATHTQSDAHCAASGSPAAPHSTPRPSHTWPRPQHSAGRPTINSTPHIRKMRTRWERVPSSGCSDSSRSSRASSVEYAWDLADYANNSTVSTTGDQSHLEPQVEAQSSWQHGPEVTNIGLPVVISDYSEGEWKGSTDRAKVIREGYSKIPSLLSCHRMSVVRGDNYCGLRSTLFQVLVSGHRVTNHWTGIIPVMDSLHDMYQSDSNCLAHWTFANRLPGHCADRLSSLSKCALSLYATIEEVCNLSSWEEREKRTLGLFNSSSTFDLELMEGLKLMMFLKLVEMKKLLDIGEDVPVFGHLLFARDSSETVEAFLKNHLNRVGDTGGLEQVEMCLLGYCLGVRIRVLRLSQCGQQDFDCVFPEDVPSDWPEVQLIAEDDRHYNVPLP